MRLDTSQQLKMLLNNICNEWRYERDDASTNKDPKEEMNNSYEAIFSL